MEEKKIAEDPFDLVGDAPDSGNKQAQKQNFMVNLNP